MAAIILTLRKRKSLWKELSSGYGAGIFEILIVGIFRKPHRRFSLGLRSRPGEQNKQQKYNCNFTTDLQEITNDPSISIVSVATLILPIEILA